MNISVIQEDGTENEFEFEICCESCVYEKYGWNKNQYDKFLEMVQSGCIKISNEIDSESDFIKFVKTL